MTLESDTYEGIHQLVLEANIIDSQFLVKYARTGLTDPPFKKRRVYCKELGLLIQGLPSFDTPNQLFGITAYKKLWYFGELIEKDNQWKKHQDKPYPYSSSLGINMAKALVNIASNGNKNNALIALYLSMMFMVIQSKIERKFVVLKAGTVFGLIMLLFNRYMGIAIIITSLLACGLICFIFGMAEAYYGSILCQKTDALY